MAKGTRKLGASKRAAKSKKAAKARKPSQSPTRGRARGSGLSALDIPAPEPIHIRPPELLRRRDDATAATLNVMEGARPEAQTIIYVHGIANKPPASILKCQWDHALFGVDLGDRSRMAYWVNRAFYPRPTDATCGDADQVNVDDDEVTTRTIMALSKGAAADTADPVEQEIEALADSEAQYRFLRSIADKMETAEMPAGGIAAAEVGAKVLPLPRWARGLLVSRLTRAFLRDVNEFFFNAERRKAMTDSLTERLAAGGGPFVIVAHSQGTMIAYEVLRHLKKTDADVRLLVTVGSPLGLKEVQDVFHKWTGATGKLPIPACVARWVNVADRLDPVALDNDISNDFDGKIKIENEGNRILNADSPWSPHSATGYLKTRFAREAVNETLGQAFAQAVGKAIISSDLVNRLEDSGSTDLHKTLIQLWTEDWKQGEPAENLIGTREMVISAIEEMAAQRPDNRDAQIERMRRFVSASLTREEVERLRTQFRSLNIQRIWQDMAKRALIHDSTNTVQARPANLGYGATGTDIGWAVLDTGIRGDHPHFEKHDTIAAVWDCTVPGRPVARTIGTPDWNTNDKNGHGTHVAATIAGEMEVTRRDGRRLNMAGMAPLAKIFSFKVLDDQGNGQDSFIIKALDQIAELNESSSRLMIHGVNLSLGGNFDPSVYGCGHTPLCQELRRLWRQGVLVCLAAGNEGYAMLRSDAGFMPANLDISIGDPANLEEAIAVGSVHKTNPHTFGISYFSSRGPTADGRRKPDLVAPGERIVSALHKWATTKKAKDLVLEDLYVEMSGTSMATPHVSGVLAAFLSIRREFIGFPDRVKTMLLKSCTDLARDPYMQGAGMPNLIRMLLEN